MSHYTCMVVLPGQPTSPHDLSEMLDTLLEPFNENREVPRYKAYEGPLPEDWRERRPRFEAARRAMPALRVDDQVPDHLLPDWEAHRVVCQANEIPWPWSAIDDPGLDLDDASLVAKLLNEQWEPDEYGADENGLYRWSTYNPDSKWDWWSLGGRWLGYFQVPPEAESFSGRPGAFDNEAPRAQGGKPADACRKGDILIDAMQLAAAQRFGASYDDADRCSDPAQRLFIYDIRPDESRQDYILRKTDPGDLLRPYAVLAEGVWREPGRMGWWAVSSADDKDRDDYATWFARFWSAAPDETWVAVCDLHI